jgi:nitroimidazol reductase NimA-like FMN-containing flavoprotein (pyridoxamine 5'-phosphate oxidase superfamily)
MDIEKMPLMKKAEYDEIINDQYICRIAFKGEKHPYIAPFLYVFGEIHVLPLDQIRKES